MRSHNMFKTLSPPRVCIHAKSTTKNRSMLNKAARCRLSIASAVLQSTTSSQAKCERVALRELFMSAKSFASICVTAVNDSKESSHSPGKAWTPPIATALVRSQAAKDNSIHPCKECTGIRRPMPLNMTSSSSSLVSSFSAPGSASRSSKQFDCTSMKSFSLMLSKLSMRPRCFFITLRAFSLNKGSAACLNSFAPSKELSTACVSSFSTNLHWPFSTLRIFLTPPSFKTCSHKPARCCKKSSGVTSRVGSFNIATKPP
mmetsp:Transcript_54776/g.130634  ORF Transcript_54776/g.130634 Transcript_54776/m.130634 type:complete len:259 (-) Transcript_54776:308-1084(-)